MGTHIVQTVATVFPYLCFGKKSFNLSNTKRRPAVLLRRPDGCNLEQFEASRHRGRFERKVLECPDRISRHSDEFKGSDSSDLETMQNLLEEL
jgi:hypothetical protein